jgi:hypothetical protein
MGWNTSGMRRIARRVRGYFDFPPERYDWRQRQVTRAAINIDTLAAVGVRYPSDITYHQLEVPKPHLQLS